MSGKVSYVFAWVLSTYLVHESEGGLLWTRDKKLDDLDVDELFIGEKKNAVSVGRCASLCTSSPSCSSFFFQPTSEKCFMSELVRAKSWTNLLSPGASYFKADSEACSSRHGFVWVRSAHICIKIYPSRTTFHYAYGNCTSVGLRLAVLDNFYKISAVKAYLQDLEEPIEEVYIGGMRDGVVNGNRTSWDSNLDPLYWLNGEIVPTTGIGLFWYNGQPDNDGGSEGCIKLRLENMHDVRCDLSLSFICEKLLT